MTKEKVSMFDAAIITFEYRLETKLKTRWEDLLYEDTLYYVSPPVEIRRALNHFFQEAEKSIQALVHEYFPKLLHIAAANPQYFRTTPPLAWTKAEVLKQVCAFLGVDEKFDHSSAPREDSKLVKAATRIALGFGQPDEVVPADFVLPGWAGKDWIMREALGSKSSTERDDRFLPPLSRAETLEWFKQREWSINGVLKKQIEDDGLDGIIEAGKTGVPILDVGGRVNRAQESTQLVSFERHPDGTIMAVPPFLPTALLNSYVAFWSTLSQVRTMITKESPRPSSTDLEKKFSDTELGKVAAIRDYKEWIHIFSEQPRTTPRNIALVFLERKTGLNRKSIKTLMSGARKLVKR